MNEIVRQKVAAELVVADPFDPAVVHQATDVDAIVARGNERVNMWREKLAALGELGEAPSAALKELKDAIAADNKALTSYAEKYAAGVVEFVGLSETVQKLRVQIKGAKRVVDPISVRGKLEAMLKQIDAAIDAQKPKAPSHSYVVRVCCTDAALDKICKYAVKEGAQDICVATAQSDKAVKQIIKWFEENM